MNTAVIYFSRLPGEETRYKTFCARNRHINNLVSAKLYNHVKNEIVKTGLPVYYYTEAKQTGNTFGEKISNACKEVFALGYASVVVVGSDSPGLNAGLITDAAVHLRTNSYIAGPTQVGGCYLFGVQKEVFSAHGITHLDWQTTSLLRSISAAYPEVIFLAHLREINSEQQLLEFLFRTGSTLGVLASFKNLLKSWLQKQVQYIKSEKLQSQFSVSVSLGRAP